MGQYHRIANYDKKQFLRPNAFDEGLKFLEFGMSSCGTLLGLVVLLAASNTPTSRGGGDLHPCRDNPPIDPARADWLMRNVVGSWAGDRIAIIGDYATAEDASGLIGREGEPNEANGWTDVSALAIEAMELDGDVYSDRHPKKS